MTQEEQLKLLVNDFTVYLNYVYKHINLPNSTPLQQRISSILGDGFERLILEAGRGVGKSYIGAIYASWRLLRDNNEKIIIVSGSGPKSIEISTFLRSLFTLVPILKHLEPDGRDSVLSFDVRGCDTSIAPSVSSVGINSQIVGKRATLVIADDVEIPTNSTTELMREKLLSSVRGFEPLLIPDKLNSILFLGTPQSMESIYNKLPYPTIVLPALVPEDESIYEGKLDPWIMLQGTPGTPVDKIRFSKETLDKMLLGMGAPDFKLQFMLDTSLSDIMKYPLKTKDMIVHNLNKEESYMVINHSVNNEHIIKEIDNLGFTGDRFFRESSYSPETKKYDRIIMSIDPSGKGTDETTYAILGVLSGKVFVLDWGGTKEGYSDKALMMLALKAEEYKVHEIVPEKNFGSGMFTELFKKVLNMVYPCTVIDDFNVKGQKEVRIIDNILPLFTNHNIVFNEETIKKEILWVKENPKENLQYSLIYQITHVTYDRGCLVHDDRIDALAIACQYVAGDVIINADERLKQIKELEMKNWLQEKIYKNYKSSKSSFISNIKRSK